VKFGNPKYIGDPINAVRIFNEKLVDELLVVDIDATSRGTGPNYNLISKLATECRMPFCYGGGVNSIDQFERIISSGVEKVAVSSAFVKCPDLISTAASRFGSQSVVGVIDTKRTGILRQHEVMIMNGTLGTGLHPKHWAIRLESLGVGEIVINSIDRDGLMAGYDLDLIGDVKGAINTPLTVVGGAGSLQDINDLFSRFGILGASAGSLFVFKGKYKAVLINYPDFNEKEKLIAVGVGQ
jgi:cyclase